MKLKSLNLGNALATCQATSMRRYRFVRTSVRQSKAFSLFSRNVLIVSAVAANLAQSGIETIKSRPISFHLITERQISRRDQPDQRKNDASDFTRKNNVIQSVTSVFTPSLSSFPSCDFAIGFHFAGNRCNLAGINYSQLQPTTANHQLVETSTRGMLTQRWPKLGQTSL